jgi:SAM-dependent methyltransferase
VTETSKSYNLRIREGHFEEYLKGKGIDIGAGPDPLVVLDGTVKGYDFKQGDANFMEDQKDNIYDFVYSSHCLEHMKSVRTSLFNWCRILKPGGYLYVTVPDFELYEKLNWPSNFNLDHKFSFSKDYKRSDVNRINHYHMVEDLEPLLNSYNVNLIEAVLQDEGYDYSKGNKEDQTLTGALVQINIIGQKKL